jgi:hypothetical protein
MPGVPTKVGFIMFTLVGIGPVVEDAQRKGCGICQRAIQLTKTLGLKYLIRYFSRKKRSKIKAVPLPKCNARSGNINIGTVGAIIIISLIKMP